MPAATILAPARRAYRGVLTDPARWAVWDPRPGDILVCTPPKCGTTWTQTMLAMLIHGGADLPATLPVLSPWVDADLGTPADEVAADLAAQEGRRVVKTHTPADGFPVWDGVTVIALYRHPLDVFFSLRKHNANMVRADGVDHPMRWDLERSARAFVEGGVDPDDFDRDTLGTFGAHYRQTVGTGRVPDTHVFHYADFLADGRAAVATLARTAGIDADDALIDRVARATAFGAMKARAADYAPAGGTGFWKQDGAFFDSASSGKWQGRLPDAVLARYDARMAELVPDRAARRWIEGGGR